MQPIKYLFYLSIRRLKILPRHRRPVQTHFLSWLNIVVQYTNADQQNVNYLLSNKWMQGGGM